ncbi:hypothetical protein Nmel_003435 [Mimus melanotis]
MFSWLIKKMKVTSALLIVPD